MKRKYVKVFEELDKSRFKGLNESPVPVDPIDDETPEEGNEEPRDEDDEAEEAAEREMTPGELRAYKRGLDVLTDEQMAAMWIKAKDRINWKQDRTRVEDQAQLTVLRDERRQALEAGDWTKATYGLLTKAMELKEMTVTRTTAKFMRLQKDMGESESEVLYPKIIKAHNRFKEMAPAEVKAMADEAVHFAGLKPPRKITVGSVKNPENIRELKSIFMSFYNSSGKNLGVTFKRFMTFCRTKKEYNETQTDLAIALVIKGTLFMESEWARFKRKLANRPEPQANVTVGPGQDQEGI